MKIVHLIFSFNTGGSETMLVDILHQQNIVCQTYLVIVNDDISADVLATLPVETKVYQIGRRPGSRNPLPILRLNKLIQAINPDVVHMHNEDAAALFFKLFGGTWSKCVTIHGLQKTCSNLYRYDQIFAISRAVQQDLSRRCGYEATVVLNGVDFQKICRRKKLFIKDNIYRIVQVGRLDHEKKGQHLLIKAIAELRNQTDVGLEVTFIGEGKSLPFIQELSTRLGVESSCTFASLWPRDKIYKKLCEFDVLVQPSIYEGFGLTVVEGMAAGIPVLAAEDGGPDEILQHGLYGWLFTNGSEHALAGKLSEILDQIRAKTIATKINAAYEHAHVNYSIATTATNYIKEYKLLCGK